MLRLQLNMSSQSCADESCHSQPVARCCKCVTRPCSTCSCVKHGRRCTSCRFGERCPNLKDPTNPSQDTSDLADYAADLRQDGRVLPRIPKAARIAVAGALAQHVTAVVSDGTPQAWKSLLGFAYTVLQVTESRRDKSQRRSLASKIRQNISVLRCFDRPAR